MAAVFSGRRSEFPGSVTLFLRQAAFRQRVESGRITGVRTARRLQKAILERVGGRRATEAEHENDPAEKNE